MFRFVRPLAITAVMIAAVTSAQAHTSENVLFVCSGTLEGDHGYTINDKLDELTYPMSCDIDEKVVKQVLKVCHVGKSYIVSAKGESGNRNEYLIQKVSRFSLLLGSTSDWRETADMPAGILWPSG